MNIESVTWMCNNTVICVWITVYLFHIMLALLDAKCDVVSGFWGNCSVGSTAECRQYCWVKAVLLSEGSTAEWRQYSDRISANHILIGWIPGYQVSNHCPSCGTVKYLWVLDAFWEYCHTLSSSPDEKPHRDKHWWDISADWPDDFGIFHPNFQLNIISQMLLVTVDVLHLFAVCMCANVPKAEIISLYKRVQWVMVTPD